MAIPVSTASNTGTTSVVVSKPSGQWAAGNLLIGQAVAYGTTTIPATPAGWFLVKSVTTGSGTTAVSMAVFQMAVGSGGGAASYTFTTTGASHGSAAVAEYSSSVAIGIDASASNTGTTSTTLTFTGTNLTYGSQVVLLCAGLGSGTRTASGWTSPFAQEIYQAGGSGDGSLYLADATVTATGATGNKTATLTGSAVNWVTITVGLVPPGPIPTYPIGGTTAAAITVPANGVPAGSLIVVHGYDYNGTFSNPRVSDTAGNTYTLAASVAINNSVSANGEAFMFYCYNSTALVSGNTITYADVNSPDSNSDVSAWYATGIQTSSSPLDLHSTAFGSSTSVTITSGTPSVAGELFVGWVVQGAGVTGVEPSGWSTPVVVTPATSYLYELVGAATNSGTGTKTFAPASTATGVWGVLIASFKPAAGAPAAIAPMCIWFS